jgi:hypothetical protein
MRKQIAVMVLLISTLTLTAPALGSTTEVTRPATTVTTISDSSSDDANTQELRRFCAANPRHDRCVNQPVVSVRQMIWRLINAGEWRQLFQLLHRLGII